MAPSSISAFNSSRFRLRTPAMKFSKCVSRSVRAGPGLPSGPIKLVYLL